MADNIIIANAPDYSSMLGRQRIYTDEIEINEDNIFKVLRDAWPVHQKNAMQMDFLLNYEKGNQPLRRTKTVRPDIDVKVSDNVANQVTVFKCGYIWGSPILFVQRGNVDLKESDADKQDNAVSLLNEMNEAEFASTKDQELARYVEICGIGYQMVDVRPIYDGVSAFELLTLNPRYTFCIYSNNAKQEKLAGVTYSVNMKTHDRYYTVYTPTHRYDVVNLLAWDDTKKKELRDEWDELPRSGEANPLGMIPIVEYVRSADRTGCFERQLSDMDALNIEVSDFANTVAQTTQEIFWGNDFELPRDPDTGQRVPPKSGQWLMTRTIGQGHPSVQALHSQLNLANVQENIVSKRNIILQKCYVPLQSEPGGGSTGSAMSMSSGWTAAESAACMEEQMLRRSKMEIAMLEIRAINVTVGIPKDSPLLTLSPSDVKPQFTRNKTYDLITKVNGMVTMIKSGINGRVAMETADLFADVSQAWVDSREMIEKLQDSIVNKGSSESKEGVNDLSQQLENSPIINGMDEIDPQTDEESAKRDGDV